jgi:hypothetical protein
MAALGASRLIIKEWEGHTASPARHSPLAPATPTPYPRGPGRFGCPLPSSRR